MLIAFGLSLFLKDTDKTHSISLPTDRITGMLHSQCSDHPAENWGEMKLN